MEMEVVEWNGLIFSVLGMLGDAGTLPTASDSCRMLFLSVGAGARIDALLK